MKATIILIAGNNAENYGTKLMLEANRHGKIGFDKRQFGKNSEK